MFRVYRMTHWLLVLNSRLNVWKCTRVDVIQHVLHDPGHSKFKVWASKSEDFQPERRLVFAQKLKSDFKRHNGAMYSFAQMLLLKNQQSNME